MDKSYLFSIVMSVHDVESYIEEAVESVLAQSIGFAENIQIVFVNDASTDGSGEICKAYRDEYPENIVYLEQEDAGLASARNTGLSYATGTYLSFFNPDDILSSNALEEVAAFFAAHEDEVDMVAIPLICFGGQNGLHGKYRNMGKKNRVIDLLDEPANFVLSAASSFYKRCRFDNLRFNEKLRIEEDADLIFRFFKKRPRFGYVCEGGVAYRYRHRTASNSHIDTLRSEKDAQSAFDVLASMDCLFADENGGLQAYEKEFIAYQLRAMLRSSGKGAFESEELRNRFIERCKKLVSTFDTEFILHASKIIDTNMRKQLFLTLRGSSFKECFADGTLSMSQFDVSLKDLRFTEETFTLDLVFYNYGCPFDVIITGPDNVRYEPALSQDLSSSFDAVHGAFTIDQTHHRRFILPYAIGEYSLCFVNCTTGDTEPVKRVRPMKKPPLMTIGSTLGVCRFGKKLFIDGSSLKVVEERRGALMRGLDSAKSLKKEKGIRTWFRPFAKDKKKFVLIMDRPNKAGDNGLALYEHIMRHGNALLRRRTYFVLDKKSASYAGVPCKSHVLQPGSIRHKLVFLNARVVYSTHNLVQFYLPFAREGRDYADLLDYEFVWLQHGITQNDVAKAANALRVEDDYITVATEGERSAFLEDRYFYEPSQILLTGFSRYDKLESIPQRVITIAPTWRSSLCGKILSTGFNEALPGFTKSKYYTVLRELLTSKRLAALLAKHDFRCQFLCHMGFACYEGEFERLASDRVEIVHQANADYTQIFSESSIFVTDYSSTAFDFAYLGKPLIYFQFDELTQYGAGWFDYEKEGLGPVTRTVEETIDTIERYLDCGCKPDAFYARRIDSFFAYRDKSNCARLLDATLPASLKKA